MTEKNPWKTLGTRLVYENPWIRVREDRVLRPDGEEGIYSVVEPALAVGTLALTSQEELYLVGQYRYPLGCYSWEIIEGGGKPAESALETAQRELREEAGLVARNWEPLGGDIHLSNCFTSEVGRLFVARDLHQVEAEPEGTEVLQVRKLAFGECLAMVENAEITDSLSIIGILNLARQLGV